MPNKKEVENEDEVKKGPFGFILPNKEKGERSPFSYVNTDTGSLINEKRDPEFFKNFGIIDPE